jgi:hypothetical protein
VRSEHFLADGTPFDPTGGPRLLDEKLKAKYPKRRTMCSRLLAECVGGATLTEREQAAKYLWVIDCRIGLKLVSGLLEATLSQNPIDLALGNYYRYLLFVLSGIGSPDSHAMIVRVVEGAASASLQADALEALAHGPQLIQSEFFYQYLAPHLPSGIKISALYAIDTYQVIKSDPMTVRNLVAPLLSDPHPMVRLWAIETLSHDSQNLALILSLINDGNPDVVKTATDAIEMIRENP